MQIRTSAQRQNSKGQWINIHTVHVIAMAIQSANKTEVVHQPAVGKPYNCDCQWIKR